MNALWRWFILRRLLGERTRTLLTVSGVALGVAVFVAVRLANRSALASFADSVDAVAGRADLEVRASSDGFDERWFLAARRVPGVEAAAPMVEAWVPAFAAPAAPGAPPAPHETLMLLGLDPLLERPFARGLAGAGRSADFAAGGGLLEPRSALIPRSLATRHGLAPGSPLPVMVSGRAETLIVRGISDSEELSRINGGAIVLVDIATAQELLARPGLIDAIDLRVDPKHRDRVTAALAGALPPAASIEPPQGRTRQVADMVEAFALNLTALSFIALLVAMFLVLNAVGLAVLRWRRELGILRTLGVTRGGIVALFLGEGALLGLAGGTLGALLGALLARGALRLVSRTLADLYSVRQSGVLHADPAVLVGGVALGVGAAMFSALAPAIEAGLTLPATTTREGAHVDPAPAGSAGWAVGGAALLALAAAVAWWTVGAHRPMGGFVSAFLTLAGFALLSPAALTIGVRLAQAPLRHLTGIAGVLGARSLGATRLRGSVVISAVMVSVGMTIAMTLMVASFRRTVDTWVTQTIRGDLYVEPVGHRVNASATRLPEAFVARVRALPGVRGVDSFRATRLNGPGRGALLIGVDFDVQRRFGRLRYLPGSTGDPLALALARDGAIVTESYAHRHRVAAGDTLALALANGLARLPVTGVIYDYSTDAGAVFLDRVLYARITGERRTESLALYLAPGVDAGHAREAVIAAAGPELSITATPNQVLRRRVLQVFDQTFQVTWALQLIAIVVSVLGVTGTLTALVLQRGAEIASLRAAGARRAQVRTMVLVESGLIGGIGALLGGVAGLALALLLVDVINKQFFGWSIQFTLEPWVFVQAFVVMVVAACLAGLGPARLAAGRGAAQAMRTE